MSPPQRRRQPRPAPAQRATRSALKSRSGMLWRSGHGISWSITAPFAATTSWTFASSARRTRHLRRAKSARLPGVSATTHSTSTASPVGSRHDKCARSTTVTGSSRSTADRRPLSHPDTLAGPHKSLLRHRGALGI